MSTQSDIGLIGLAVMGENLALNIANHGFPIAVFNRTTTKVDDFVNGRAKLVPFHAAQRRSRAQVEMLLLDCGGECTEFGLVLWNNYSCHL